MQNAEQISTRLSNSPAYHRQSTQRCTPVHLDVLSEVTVGEVDKILRALPSRTSTTNYFPTFLLTSAADVTAPLITRLANLSFNSGVFPTDLKLGRVTPLIKKPGLDKSDMSNFRPITNLNALSKVLEKLVLSHLRPHIMSTGNFSEFQSAYRTGHSVETALLRVVNDVVTATDKKQATVLLSLDISAAFDTTDTDTLLNLMYVDFAVGATALKWPHSFTTGRSQYIGLDSLQQLRACWVYWGQYSLPFIYR